MPKKRSDVEVEVTDITPEGCWLRVRSENHYISFIDSHVYFLGASAEEIQDVKLHCGKYLRWEALDVDLEIDNFVYPERYPYIGLSPQQLARVREAMKTMKVSERVIRQLKRFDKQ